MEAQSAPPPPPEDVDEEGDVDVDDESPHAARTMTESVTTTTLRFAGAYPQNGKGPTPEASGPSYRPRLLQLKYVRTVESVSTRNERACM
jgi:hypothetical protein